MNDLKVERFYTPRTINGEWIHAEGPIKTFTLRGIKDSPPYLHDGRLLTLEDTVEFFQSRPGCAADASGEGGSGRLYAPAVTARDAGAQWGPGAAPTVQSSPSS